MRDVDQKVLDIISNSEIRNNILYLPDVQLDRKLYLDVNKVLESLGGKWNRKAKGHIFESDPTDTIDQVILTGAYVDKRQEFQFMVL